MGVRADGHPCSACQDHAPAIDAIASLCKRRGFVFQASEIYGGFDGTDPLASCELFDPAAGGYCAFEGWVRNENEGHEVLRLEYEGPAELLRDLRALGVTSAARDRARGLGGHREHRRRGHRAFCGRTGCALLDVDDRAGRHGDEILGSTSVRQIPDHERARRTVRGPHVLPVARYPNTVARAVPGMAVCLLYGTGRVRHRVHGAVQLRGQSA